MTVHLKDFGFIKVLRIVSTDGDTQYWTTDVLDMQEEKRKEFAKKGWKIEEFHRGIKQFCGAECCHAIRTNVQVAYFHSSKSILSCGRAW
jgi:IS4 transposase